MISDLFNWFYQRRTNYNQEKINYFSSMSAKVKQVTKGITFGVFEEKIINMNRVLNLLCISIIVYSIFPLLNIVNCVKFSLILLIKLFAYYLVRIHVLLAIQRVIIFVENVNRTHTKDFMLLMGSYQSCDFSNCFCTCVITWLG